MLSGWVADYRQFKELILNDPDKDTQIKYRQILNGLYFSVGGLVVFVVLVLRNHL